tara:strand:+ start:1928 stop:2053 length:126 start_codon:yes stop_codon:yes gene_type:complete
MDTNKETKKVSLRGVKKGEATSVAIIEELSGRNICKGAAIN